MSTITSAVDSVGNAFSGVGDVVTDSKGRTGTVVAVLPRGEDNTMHFQVRFTFAYGAELAHISEQKMYSKLLTLVSRGDGVALGPQIGPVTAEKSLSTIGNTSEYLQYPI